MAPRNKENGGARSQKGVKRTRQVSSVEPESSEEDYRKKRDKNNQVSATFLDDSVLLESDFEP